MSFLFDFQRAAVIREAEEWVTAKTKYIPHGQLKGVGCDCATFILCVYRTIGLIPEIDPGAYAIDEHLHTETTKYVDAILKYSDEITEEEARPGDLVLFRVAKAFAHGAIITAFPTVIHSMVKHGVIFSILIRFCYAGGGVFSEGTSIRAKTACYNERLVPSAKDRNPAAI
jgi:cell wall-associated NlpC family hydrolase